MPGTIGGYRPNFSSSVSCSPQIAVDTGHAPDDYVLATSITRDNDGPELMVLVKPSLAN